MRHCHLLSTLLPTPTHEVARSQRSAAEADATAAARPASERDAVASMLPWQSLCVRQPACARLSLSLFAPSRWRVT
jgi:hypothetical protein